MAATLATVAAMTAIGASTASGFVSNRRAAKTAEAQGNYAAQVFGINATLADQQAEDAIARGREAELRAGAAGRQFVGTQRAAAAASGVDVNSGSALDLQIESKFLTDLEQTEIRNNAAREAWGYRVEATGYRSQAETARQAGRNEAAAYRQQTYGTLLTGGARIFDLYANRPRAAQKPQTRRVVYNGQDITPGIKTVKDITGHSRK